GRQARGRRDPAVPEHAPLHRALPAGDGEGRGGAARRGHRAGPDADPRRHRRLTPERDGPADAEPVHGRPRVPLTAGMGVAAGDERGSGDGGAAGGGLGSRWSATPAMTSPIPSPSVADGTCVSTTRPTTVAVA